MSMKPFLGAALFVVEEKPIYWCKVDGQDFPYLLVGFPEVRIESYS